MSQLNNMKTDKVFAKTSSKIIVIFSLGISLLLASCSAGTSNGGEQTSYNPDEPNNYVSVLSDRSLTEVSALLEERPLIEFDLIDATNGQVIAGYDNLQNNQAIVLDNIAAKKLSIKVRVDASVREKSVKISFGSNRKTENEAPYTAFGDNERGIASKSFPLGEVNLVASAHPKARAGGTALTVAQVKLKISKTPPVDNPDDENSGTTAGETTAGNTTVGDTTAGSTTAGNNSGDIPAEVNGIVRIEAESAPLTLNWQSGAADGRNYIVWRGIGYDTPNNENAPDFCNAGEASTTQNPCVPVASRLRYKFRVNSPGTFKVAVHSRRENGTRPLPVGENECNGLSGAQELCIDRENDAFLGVDAMNKLYMSFFYYNDPTRMQVFPYNEWVSGGRIDTPARQIPMYVLTTGENEISLAPRSPNFMIDALELTRIDDGNTGGTTSGQTTAGSTTAGGTTAGGTTAGGDNESELGQMTDISSALNKQFVYFGKYKRNADGSILLGGTDGKTPQTTSGGVSDGAGLGAGLTLAVAAHTGDVRADVKLLEYIRFLLLPNREPLFNGGYNSQHEVMVTSMFVVVKNTARIWDQLSAVEKSRITTMMKASLIANAYTSGGDNRYGIDGDSNIYLGGNPNYRVGMVGSVITAVSYFGVAEANNILKNYNQAAFITELTNAQLNNTLSVWNFVVPSGYTNNSPRGVWKKPSAASVEGAVKSFKYASESNGSLGVSDFMKMQKDITDFAYGAKVACGLNNGAGRTDGGCGKVVSGCSSNFPNFGATGMIRELASGDRSSASYAWDVMKANQAAQLALISAGLFDESVLGSAKDKNIIGNDDLINKLELGYFNSKEGRDCSTQQVWKITDDDAFAVADAKFWKGFRYNIPLWDEVLKPYLQGNSGGDTGGTTAGQTTAGGTTAGETTAGGITSGNTGGQTTECVAGTVENRTMFLTSSVPKGQACVSQPQTRTCSADGLWNAFSGTYTHANCYEQGDTKQPVRRESFGPNGTHWPSLIPTPFMYDRNVANIIEIDASWSEVERVLSSVTAKMANDGTLILIRTPADRTKGLVGIGTSTPIIKTGLGSKAWTRRVTIAPKDGYGAVRMNGDTKLERVFGVAFTGFIAEDLKFQGCSNSALAWMKVEGYLGVHGYAGETAEKVELTEIVMPESQVRSDDTADIYSAGGTITNWLIEGTYIAPRFYEEKSYPNGNPHTDTLQFANGSKSGPYGNVTIRDSAFFASNNCAIQTGNINGLKLEHSYVAAGDVSRSRYSFLPGGHAEGANAAFNGSGKNFEATDSVIFGTLALNTKDAAQPWTKVTNTRINKMPTSAYNKPQNGNWTEVPDLAKQVSMPTHPKDAYLISIWATPFK